MDNALTIAIQSMQQDVSRLSVHSSNLTNASTPGFKRETITSLPFLSFVDRISANSELPIKISRNLQPGVFRATGNFMDVSVEGIGFFELQMQSGPVYSRRGDFQVDSRGRLVNYAGLPVMGVTGEITLNSNKPIIEANGNVLENGKLVGQIKVVEFGGLESSFKMISPEVFDAGAAPALPVRPETKLRQGFLEGSNVNSTTEIISLMETLRRFEGAQRVVRAYDEMLEKSIRKLADM